MNTTHTAKQQPLSAKVITYTALATAIIFIMTFVPKIPFPFGYAHLGDAMIFVAALFFPRRQAALAAGIGSALADFVGGYPVWMIATFIIKYLMVEVVWLVVRPDRNDVKIVSARTILAIAASCVWMIVTYAIAGAIIYGSPAAGTAMLPGLLGKGISNAIIAYVIAVALDRMRFSVTDNN